MKSKTEWHHRFFDSLYGRVLAGRFDQERTRRQAALVKKVLRLRRRQSVLDCPCGLGRLTIPLAKMGLQVTGVDFQPLYLARARRSARKERAQAQFLRCDMRELPFADQFDAVINWFTSFGYFDEAGNLAAARAAYAALKPGGQFLIETQNKTWTAKHQRPSSQETLNGVHVTDSHRWDDQTSRIEATSTLRLGRRSRRTGFSIRVYSGPELRALLRAAGFRDVQFFGHTPTGTTRLTRHSRRLIAVGTKPRESKSGRCR